MDQFYLEMILLIGAILLPAVAQGYIMMTYAKYKGQVAHQTKTGYDVAREILDKNGLTNIYIVETAGKLTDHYDPARKTIRLSHEIYHGSSVAALAVAAHEVGHAMQDKEGHFFLKLRSLIFPVVRLGTGFAYIVLLIGFIMEQFELIRFGIGLVALGLIFQLITLPVEFDASKKAKTELDKINISDEKTQSGVSRMLRSAALTYVAGVLASAMSIVRLILIMNRNR